MKRFKYLPLLCAWAFWIGMLIGTLTDRPAKSLLHFFDHKSVAPPKLEVSKPIILDTINIQGEVGDLRCPPEMVYIEGDFCPDLSEPCLKWGDTKEVDDWNKSNPDAIKPRSYNICLEFKNPTVCNSKKLRHIKFCMDKYEFPNWEGEIPDVMWTYLDMEKNCTDLGKRLCKDYEFNKACEGPENKPYPYGYVRDVTACNINKPYIDWDMEKISHHDWDEVKRLDQRVPSGFYSKCVSDYGVHDLVGNVDEFYTNSSGVPTKVAMMGGHWIHGARNRCRAATLSHNEWFFIYEAGGRCCADPTFGPVIDREDL